MTTPTSRARPRSRARRGEGERLRADILAAAGRLLAEHGDEAAVSVRAVAEAVGVSTPSIYLHFADKEALILAVCEETFARFDADQETAAAGHLDPLESLRARGRAYVQFGLDRPEAYRVLFMTRSTRVISIDGTSEEAAKAGVAALLHFVEAVRRCIDGGSFAPADPMLVALQLWSGLHGLVSLLICELGFPWPDRDLLVDRVLDMQVRGLAP